MLTQLLHVLEFNVVLGHGLQSQQAAEESATGSAHWRARHINLHAHVESMAVVLIDDRHQRNIEVRNIVM